MEDGMEKAKQRFYSNKSLLTKTKRYTQGGVAIFRVAQCVINSGHGQLKT